MIGQAKRDGRAYLHRDHTSTRDPVSFSDGPPLVMGSADFALGRWIIEQGLTGESLASLVEGACEQLAAAGIPIWRTFLAMPMINPDLRAVALQWHRGGLRG